jgi:hypothetical protein
VPLIVSVPSLPSFHVRLVPHLPLATVRDANAMLGKIEKTIIAAKIAAKNLILLFIVLLLSLTDLQKSMLYCKS